jgi:formylglycine-generating enzyme required for sulfatase activity
LPGTAGSKSEQQTKTSVMQMGRITSPVEEGETPHEESPSSGELKQPRAPEPALEIPAEQAASPESTTSGFGSEPGASPSSAEGGTETFASPLAKSPAAPHAQVSQDEVRTREFVRPSLPDEGTPTRIQQAWPGAPQNIVESQRANAQPAEAGITRDISSAVVTTLPVEQASSQPLPKKRTGVLIASAAVALIIILAAVFVGYWLLFGHGRASRQPAPPVAVEPPKPAPEGPVTPAKPAAPVAPEGMIAVAAGSYTIGRNGADPLEQPQHKIDLPTVFIDRTEVTNAAYKKFVDATGHKPPSNWSGANFPARRDNFPVTGVTWQDAADYAAWAGKRLPSEGEWEAAARGTDGRIYPWGNEWRTGLANIGLTPDKPTAEQYPAALREVGGYPQSASPIGAMDMIGNAWEWMADEIALYAGNTDPKAKKRLEDLTAGVVYRVIRGGAYDGSQDHDATYRGFLDAGLAYPKVGFRCVKDAK